MPINTAAKRLTNVTTKAGSFDYYMAATAPGSAQIKKLLLSNTSYITNAERGQSRQLTMRPGEVRKERGSWH